MSKKFRRAPILADTFQIPRYKYSEKDEEYYDTPNEYGLKRSDWTTVFRTKTNTIDVPDKLNDIRDRDTHIVIKDTDGHELLKEGYYPHRVIDDIARKLPHWGFEIIEQKTGALNVWTVERFKDDYITVTTRPWPGSVNSSSDMYGVDNSFFTRDDLADFARAVEDDVNEKFKSFNSDFSIQYIGIWLEGDDRTITMDYICFPNETEYSASVHVDMRKILSPDHVFKYVEPMANKIESQIQSEEVTGACDIEAGDDYVGNVLPFGDEDGYYHVEAYAEPRFRGLMDDFASNSFDDAILKANEYANSGFYVFIENLGSGDGREYSPDEWLECVEKTGEPPYSVYNLSDGNIEASASITCSSNIDALERIAHDTFNDVLSGRSRDAVTDDVILEAAMKYDPNMSAADQEKVIDLTNEQIDSYFNRGPFGQVQAEKYGDMILKAYNGRTISKSQAEANGPDGLTTCANAIGLGTFQLLEALEGMCADGRARETSDSTYYIGKY